MKGIILAGGLGTRLMPLTKITNKHLLPVYNKPMIYYPIKTLVDAGIEEIMIVTGGNHAGDFLRLLSNGKEFGLKDIHYTYQEGEGGIADALKLTEHFAEGDKICVILGDNIIEDNIKKYVDNFKSSPYEAKILLKKVKDPQRFGVAEIEITETSDRIISIEEKPKNPKSDLAVIGVYMYSNNVYDIIRTLKPSNRNELEITDVNNDYLYRGELTFDVIEKEWTDAGTFESLLKANNLVKEWSNGKN